LHCVPCSHLCVFPVSPQETSLPPRFRALSYQQVAPPPTQLHTQVHQMLQLQRMNAAMATMLLGGKHSACAATQLNWVPTNLSLAPAPHPYTPETSAQDVSRYVVFTLQRPTHTTAHKRRATCCAYEWPSGSAFVCGVCPMSLVWLELLELMKGQSGVALSQFSSSSRMLQWQPCCYAARRSSLFATAPTSTPPPPRHKL
jgi:hypothetical protein